MSDIGGSFAHTGVYAIDDDFDDAGYTLWWGLRGAGLELAFVAGKDNDATDDMLFWVYSDASESTDIVRSFINVEHPDISLNGRSPSSSISFSTSEPSLGLSSSTVPSPWAERIPPSRMRRIYPQSAITRIGTRSWFQYWWGWRNPRSRIDRHQHLSCHRESRIAVIVVDIRSALPRSCRICGWS